jgi:hypothetical protein
MESREIARAAGPPKRRKTTGPAVDSMRVAGQVTRVREGARKSLAETEQQDAASD